MKRLIPIFALLPILLSCQKVGTRVWRASGDNGDKPGIGLELRMDAQEISGYAFLLDPDSPHDFSHTGLRRPMTVISQSPNEISFRIAWNETSTEILVFSIRKGRLARFIRGYCDFNSRDRNLPAAAFHVQKAPIKSSPNPSRR